MPSIIEVVGMGFGTVFVGLICIVVLISVMNWIFSFIKPKEEKKPDNTVAAQSGDAKMSGEEVAAVSAAIAEVLGRDVSGIRITSIKKIN